MGFVGPNGAGKTTTIKIIMNLMQKNAGEIKVFGKDHIKYEKEIKEKIGFVYDENYFYEELKVEDIKRIISSFYRGWNEKTFRAYAADFGINPKMKIKELSKGMKKKFCLAMALSHQADLIIMDEPTSGLDPVFRNEFLKILLDIVQDEQKGILFSTHITTDLQKVVDYICFINNGEIIINDTKDEILNRYAIVKGANELLQGNVVKLFDGIQRNRFGFEALTSDVEGVRRLLGSRVLVEKATLEDIILFVAGGEKIA